MIFQSKPRKLSLVFMGTSELSETVLEALMKKHNVIGVFTKSDAKVGRRKEKVAPLVKKLAEKHNIPVFQPDKFNSEAVEILRKLDPEIVVVAAYGKIIPKNALDIPKLGFLNLHASLLPKYRGPSPIQNALLNGESETGVTIIRMDEGIDTGDILEQEKMLISQTDTVEILTIKLSKLGADLLLRTLPLWADRKILLQPQNNSQATYCQMIEREDGHIYWTDDAESIYNRYRALTPWPGIFSFWKNGQETERLKLISVGLQKVNPQQPHKEGEVFEIGDDLGVQTANGIIILKEIQIAGKKPVDVKEFINGYSNFPGSILQ